MSDEEQDEFRDDSQVEDESEDDFLTQFRAALDKLREAGDSEELEHLENAYRIACDREHDFKTAAEIGQMLVQKNQQLMEELEEASIWRDQYDTQRDANNEILKTLERLEEANHQLQQQNQDYERSLVEQRARCEVLQNEQVTAAEMHNALEEEVEKLQDKVRSLTLEQRVNSAYKEKTRQLFEQLESTKQLTEDLQEQNAHLQKENASLKGDLAVLKTTSSKSQNAEYEVKQLREQVKHNRAIEEQNRQLKEKLATIQEQNEDLTSIVEENQRLTDAVNSLMKVNRHFREQQEKDQALLEEANHNIQTLQVTIEEQKHVSQDAALSRDPSLVSLELEQRVLDIIQRVLDDDPGSNPELNNALEAEIARRVDRLLAVRRSELETHYEVELQRQLAKAREDINMKIMEIEMAKMIERGQHAAEHRVPTDVRLAGGDATAKREREEADLEAEAADGAQKADVSVAPKRKKRSDTGDSGIPPLMAAMTDAAAPTSSEWEQGALKRRSTDMPSGRRAATMSLPPRKLSLSTARSTSPRRIFEKLAQHSPRSPLGATIGLRAPSPREESPKRPLVLPNMPAGDAPEQPQEPQQQQQQQQELLSPLDEAALQPEAPAQTAERMDEEQQPQPSEEKPVVEEEQVVTDVVTSTPEEEPLPAVSVPAPAQEEQKEKQEVVQPPAAPEVVEEEALVVEVVETAAPAAEPEAADESTTAAAAEPEVAVEVVPTPVVAVQVEVEKTEEMQRSLSAPAASSEEANESGPTRVSSADSALPAPDLESPRVRHVPPAKPVPPRPTQEEEGVSSRRSFDEASFKRPRSTSITQSLASSTSFAASTLRDTVDSVFAKPSAPSRKGSASQDKRRTTIAEARALPRLHGPEEGSMSPFTISYRNPTQTLSLSPRGGKAGTTYTLHSRPHTPSLVEELLTSAFRLESFLNRVNLFAMNSDEDNAYRLVDTMTDHIVQHVVKAKSFNCPDELRQTQKEEGTQELQRLQSLVKPVLNLLFSESNNGAYHINFRTCLKQISEANSKIATACTLSFIDDSIKFIESKIALPGVAEDEELQEQYKHLIELVPNILVMFKEALLNPEDSDRKRVLHASIDLANQIRFKLQRMGRARELPMLGGSQASSSSSSSSSTSTTSAAKPAASGGPVAAVASVAAVSTPAFATASTESSPGADARPDKGKELEKPLTVDIDQLRSEIALELEDEELLILARIDNAVERQLRLLQIEERKYIHLILDLRDKLNDANLAVMNKTMRSVLSFNELVQLSDACIDNVLKESKKLFKLPGLRNPSLMALAIDLVIEVAVLMKRCNDFSVGINQPTLEKLERFKRDYALRVRQGSAVPSPGRGGSPSKKGPPGGGILSYFFGRG